ncbi:MAG: hypothetical protein V7K21_03185 [Nostoc sp.]
MLEHYHLSSLMGIFLTFLPGQLRKISNKSIETGFSSSEAIAINRY